MNLEEYTNSSERSLNCWIRWMHLLGASRNGIAHWAQWALAFDWPIFLDLMECTNQIWELIERSVSGCVSGCTQSIQY